MYYIMPEGPEVRTVADDLRPVVSGRSIVLFENRSGKTWMLKNLEQIPLPIHVVTVSSRGKKLLFELENKGLIVASLGMTGRWSYTEGKYCHLIISFGTKTLITNTFGQPIIINAVHRSIYFTDPSSKGGGVEYIPPETRLAFLSSFGPDILAGEIPSDVWAAIFAKRKYANWEVCKLIHDQHAFGGIGNYLRAIILWLARVAPMRKVSSLHPAEIEALRVHSHRTLRESYAAGGLTIKDYWAPSGKRGIFKKIIYKEAYDPYGNPVVGYKRSKGDQTCYWVPAMQN